MGNSNIKSVPITEKYIREKVAHSFNTHCNDYVYYEYPNEKIFNYAKLFTITFNLENNKLITELNRDRELVDPTNHLDRLICIYLIIPLPEIRAIIWNYYYKLFYLQNDECIICLENHMCDKCKYLII